jgi:nitroreductase
MDLLQAIFHRRAVRHYTDAMVHPAMIADLINAAIQAPSALNQQPWTFAVIRGRQRLDGYSERAKAYMLTILPHLLGLHQRAESLASDSYNVFHHAGTLVVICAKPAGHHPEQDCLLAAENLMLAAHGMGLGTCPIGFARPWLNLPEIKRELGIPGGQSVVLPVVVGFPADTPAPVPRDEPEIVCWHRAPEDDLAGHATPPLAQTHEPSPPHAGGPD